MERPLPLSNLPRFARLVGRRDATLNLAEAALLIAQDAYPGLETGWAQPPGNGNAAATGQWNTSTSTAYGENFSQLLQALGAPPGVTEGAVQGTLPPGWPTW